MRTYWPSRDDQLRLRLLDHFPLLLILVLYCVSLCVECISPFVTCLIFVCMETLSLSRKQVFVVS